MTSASVPHTHSLTHSQSVSGSVNESIWLAGWLSAYVRGRNEFNQPHDSVAIFRDIIKGIYWERTLSCCFGWVCKMYAVLRNAHLPSPAACRQRTPGSLSPAHSHSPSLTVSHSSAMRAYAVGPAKNSLFSPSRTHSLTHPLCHSIPFRYYAVSQYKFQCITVESQLRIHHTVPCRPTTSQPVVRFRNSIFTIA